MIKMKGRLGEEKVKRKKIAADIIYFKLSLLSISMFT
jgi:hypothetical protein